MLISSLYITTTPKNSGFSKHLRFFSLHTIIVIQLMQTWLYFAGNFRLPGRQMNTEGYFRYLTKWLLYFAKP